MEGREGNRRIGEKWMSMLELIDILEKANADLRDELHELRLR